MRTVPPATLLAASLLLVSLVVGCSEAPVAKTPPADRVSTNIDVTPAVFNVAGAPTVEFEVPGMHCSACAAGVCRVLKGTTGVLDAKADADAKIATIAVDEATFDADAALAALEEEYGEATVKGDDAQNPEPTDESGESASKG
ncbi:heavy-metal-associated domain-containing protein [Botrimarina hoheduenensis]|uniref:Heavy-metal-associated domain protein n=1 Tax=Botrimarina hoheduenensis TaxID=2528000 RepID=A0A5C5WE71_9BACT|nr:heavy metal-associated domain-containing protein [Botrimarina hoheduenensis]TWT48767.1 Heavy-metal-associated domain protein [Botrimarina hoheduenensis]